ncbi:MAG: arginine kinase [Deltaproteobacteria bacterium]|nr:arginine kinase [Deltaproteobacteria bacterium]
MWIEEIARVQKSHPDNLMTRYFDPAYYDTLAPEHQRRLARIIATGWQNPDSTMGAYAMHPDDYDLFRPYLDKLIRAYHHIEGEMKQVSDWDLGDGMDLRTIDPDLDDVSMRVRVCRNLSDFPLPGAMTRTDRVALEGRMATVFDHLAAADGFGGGYVSLTPGSPHEITPARYAELVDQHRMFKDMSGDKYLSVAGISADWPHGRGMYQSEDGGFIVWVGEEDHLRVMAMERGADLGSVFERLRGGLELLTSQGLDFARSPSYGYVTSCPTNLGTGMRASLHLPLPKLTHNGADVQALKPRCKGLGLSVRGAGGEHTAAGEGGIVDISPSARLMVTEGEIARRLYQGVKDLWKEERG